MNKYLMILALFLTINGFFSLLTFLFPTLPGDKVLPIQLWFNGILLFSLLLPTSVATLPGAINVT